MQSLAHGNVAASVKVCHDFKQGQGFRVGGAISLNIQRKTIARRSVIGHHGIDGLAIGKMVCLIVLSSVGGWDKWADNWSIGR